MHSTTASKLHLSLCVDSRQDRNERPRIFHLSSGIYYNLVKRVQRSRLFQIYEQNLSGKENRDLGAEGFPGSMKDGIIGGAA